MPRFFDRDPLSGDCEFFHFDEMTGDFSIETVGDVTPILERNKADYNEWNRTYTKELGAKHIASIPTIIALKWKNELGVDVFNKDHDKKVLQLLADPDWRYLRTAPGGLRR